MYQAISGDSTIIARVASLQNALTYSKAGVMIREALTAISTTAFMAVYGPRRFH